jgi:hypothetical protein
MTALYIILAVLAGGAAVFLFFWYGLRAFIGNLLGNPPHKGKE